MTGRRAARLQPEQEVSSVSVEEAVREVRRQADRLGKVWKALRALLRSIDLPTDAEIREMRDRRRPLSKEAHLIGALHKAVTDLETCEADLRLAGQKRMLDRLEAEWKRGRRPASVELRHIEASVSALRNEARERR